jgi:hypothetical protein
MIFPALALATILGLSTIDDATGCLNVPCANGIRAVKVNIPQNVIVVFTTS